MTDHWFFSQALRIKNYILYGHSLLLEPPVSTAPPVIYQSSPNYSHTVICLLLWSATLFPASPIDLQSIVYIACATGRVLPHPTRITRTAGQVFDTSTPPIAGFMILNTTRPNPPKNGYSPSTRHLPSTRLFLIGVFKPNFERIFFER